MYNRISSIVILLLVVTAGPASGAQIFSMFDGTLDTVNPLFYPLSVQDVADEFTPGDADINKVEVTIPAPGRFHEVACVLSDPPGLGGNKGWIFTLFVNEIASSTLTCSISNTTLLRSCSSSGTAVTSHNVVVGNRLALKISPTNSPAASSVRCTIVFYPPGA